MFVHLFADRALRSSSRQRLSAYGYSWLSQRTHFYQRQTTDFPCRTSGRVRVIQLIQILGPSLRVSCNTNRSPLIACFLTSVSCTAPARTLHTRVYSRRWNNRRPWCLLKITNSECIRRRTFLKGYWPSKQENVRFDEEARPITQLHWWMGEKDFLKWRAVNAVENVLVAVWTLDFCSRNKWSKLPQKPIIQTESRYSVDTEKSYASCRVTFTNFVDNVTSNMLDGDYLAWKILSVRLRVALTHLRSSCLGAIPSAWKCANPLLQNPAPPPDTVKIRVVQALQRSVRCLGNGGLSLMRSRLFNSCKNVTSDNYCSQLECL